MNDDVINGLIRPISATRLLSYGQPDGEITSTILNYFWNIELSQAFYPLLQAFEVGLRNTINATLSELLADEWWLERSSVLGQNQRSKVAAARADLERKNKAVTPGRLVAELTFGFWTSLLNRPYETSIWHTGNPIVLVRAFPHLPKYRQTRKTVYGRMQLANSLRNRIFHFEPIWNRTHLQQDHADVLEALGWILPEMQRAVLYFDQVKLILERGREHHRDRLTEYLAQ